MSSKASRRFSPAPQGRILIATFSTSIYRLQLLSDLAEQFDLVAFVGRGMQHNSQIAERLGSSLKPGVEIRDTDVRDYTRDEVVCLCTGSQGEPAGDPAPDCHRRPSLYLSGRAIPSRFQPKHPRNEKAIAGHEPCRPPGATWSPTPTATFTSPGTAVPRN